MIISDDLEKLLKILPIEISKTIEKYPNRNQLIEIVMDLGKKPEARFSDHVHYISNKNINWQDINYCLRKLGKFNADNRTGIKNTLHRISSINNREGQIIGLTYRVGRAVLGNINIIRDLLEIGHSILILGRPGVGKTTAIREIARILADEIGKRVIIIDTSNEIAGDSDIGHFSIGRARRMQVKHPQLQHQVMIEAIENHMPEVIIIDEISTELEALAARTIAERGVQLIGTAHGNSLENLIRNSTLSDLIGGIQYVTLGDEEARKRGTQKSILERKSFPTFNIVIEIHQLHSWRIHQDVEQNVDRILQGYKPILQDRFINLDNKHIIKYNKYNNNQILDNNKTKLNGKKEYSSHLFHDLINNNVNTNHQIYLYLHSLSYKQTQSCIDNLQLPMILTKTLDNANVILGLRMQTKNTPQLREVAKNKKIPIYVISNETTPQLIKVLKNIINSYNLKKVYKNTHIFDSLKEMRMAIVNIVFSKNQIVELLPRIGYIRKYQHILAGYFNLYAISVGKEPFRRLRIYPRFLE
jgi:stage III sporulation protein SpoIIIAA